MTSVDESIQTIDPIYISAIYFLTRFVNVLIQFFFPQYLIHKQLLKCQSINFNACDVYCIPCISTLHTTNNNCNSEVNDDCADMWLIRITAAFDWKTHPMYHKYNWILERKNMDKNASFRMSHVPFYISITNLWSGMQRYVALMYSERIEIFTNFNRYDFNFSAFKWDKFLALISTTVQSLNVTS